MNQSAVRFPFQLVLMALTSALFGYCFYRSFTEFATPEQTIQVNNLTPQQIKQIGKPPGEITVGLIIRDFLTFDPIKNDFVFIGNIWFSYDPETISIDLLSKFRFDKAEILEKSEPSSTIIGNRFVVNYTIKVHFKNQLLYQYFPFDDHQLTLQLINPYALAYDVSFNTVPSNFEVTPATKSQGWTVINKTTSPGYSELQGVENPTPYPTVLFTIDYLRTGIRQAFTILLPLLALFFVSLFSFSLEPAQYATRSMAITAGSITAILAYKFVIENISPVAGYFMISDYIYLMFLCAISLTFILSIVALNQSVGIKKFLIVLLHLFVCISFVYITLFWTPR